MGGEYPRIRIRSIEGHPRSAPTGNSLVIELDDKKLNTVTSVTMQASVNRLVEVTLTMYAQVDIDIPARVVSE